MVAKMASRKHPTTMEKLPNDLLSKIFIRLLAKQVAQMRSVNKSWNSLLCQPSFIKSHLHHSIHNKDDILLFFYEPPPRRSLPFNEPFSAHPSKFPNLGLVNFIKPPGNVNFQWRYNRLIGSVNGLICLDHGSVVHIWNPSLSAVSTLPSYFVPCHPIRVTLRFGYDPKADDYKVIKLASIVRPSSFQNPRFRGFNDFVEEWLPVEVCSMRRKGSWKPITQSFPSHITRISSQYEQVCLDGIDGLLHWLGYIGQERKGPTIVAFDLGTETFHEDIPLPDSIIKHNVSNRVDVLGVLAGKLCVMSYTKGGESEVWVMDEYGVVESWVKNLAFSHFRNIVPLGFTLWNEFLFQVEKVDGHDDDYYRYGLYDPVAAKTKVFKLFVGIKNMVGYVDSLVWVAPDKHEMS